MLTREMSARAARLIVEVLAELHMSSLQHSTVVVMVRVVDRAGQVLLVPQLLVMRSPISC